MGGEEAQALAHFSSAAEQLGVSLDPQQLEQIATFCQQLGNYNRHTNLVSNASLSSLLKEHVLDSLTLVPHLREGATNDSRSLIDVGTGAGFPGAVLAIAFPDLQVVLVDSTAKKITFLKEVLGKLKLKKPYQTAVGRVEELAHHRQYRNQFDFATCRAVAPSVGLICEVVCPLLKIGGQAFLQKSWSQCTEIKAAAEAGSQLFGAQLKNVIELANQEKPRGVLIFEQQKAVAEKYPRSWRAMQKSPLF